MNQLVLKTTQEFHQRFQGAPTLFSQAPGRINVIGEHTDYTGGLCLPAAIDCWTICAWRPRTDKLIKISAANFGETWDTTWADLEKSMDRSWKKYVGGSLALFKKARLTPEALGFELAILGNVPLAKGVSSSASLELSVLNGLNLLYRGDMTPLDFAKMAQQVEHQYLHVQSGLLDQFASQFSKKQSALLIDFRTLETQAAPLGAGFDNYRWVLVDSMVKRELATSKYTERVEEYFQILQLLEKHGHRSLRDISADEVVPIFSEAAPNIRKRARHIVSENQRTLRAFECLKSGDARELGQLLLQTHRSLSEDYEVSHDGLDLLVKISKALPGVAGGRMMGGGFGGCCLFLVERGEFSTFVTRIAEEYEKLSTLRTVPFGVSFVEGASAWTHGN